MKHNLFFYAMAAASLVLTSCVEENDIVEGPPAKNVNAPIQFSSAKSTMTREGSDIVGSKAAEMLGGKFVVMGYKGANSTFTTPGSTKVFDNYVVEYAENTANTTESNTNNWEYAGKTPIAHATANGIVAQTIKYWDYSTPQYDFIAWSTGTKTAIYSGSPTTGQVLVSAITPATATGTTADPARVAYTMKGTAEDLSKCYVADLVTVKKADYDNGPVNIRFRSLGTKVRISLYETVPGYSVKNVRFYQKAGVLTDVGTQITTNATIFTTTDDDIKTQGTYTVYFPTVNNTSDADNNQAHITFEGTGGQTTMVQMGAMNYTIAEQGEKTPGKVFLGRTSSTATYAGDAEKNYYVTYLPNESGTNLNLRVDFDLEATDGSGEEIHVKNATAQVPLIYASWKPGYAYTYIFKISDKTNGRTGNYDPTKPDDDPYNTADPAGLYPITFDAVVVNDENADVFQETITTISTPSITTYQQGSAVVNNNEYTVNGKDIFVTVNEDDALVTLTGKAALYTIPAGKTEAEVVDALSYQADNAATGTIKGRSGLVLTEATSTLDNKVEWGADGNTISLSTNQALRFTPAASTTYAFVYTKTAPVGDPVVKYEALDFASFAPGDTKYRYDYKKATHSYYNVDDNGTPGDDTDDTVTEYFDAQEGVSYFSLSAGIYTKESPYLGQNVGNLYLDGAGNTVARGHAVTGTTYYYTTNFGMTYTAATNVAYADYLANYDTYFKDPAHTVANTDATPVNGQAYYTSAGKFIVILPQQTNTWYELNTASYVEADEAAAVTGQTYFDKYTKNNGVYYTKVIKVQ